MIVDDTMIMEQKIRNYIQNRILFRFVLSFKNFIEIFCYMITDIITKKS